MENRHPWIFEGAIVSDRGPTEAAIGDLVDGSGRRLASGFYSEESQIRLRALTFGEEAFSFETVAGRLEQAFARRNTILSLETTAVRLVHSEGDELSGLIVDQYADVLVAEITSAGLEKLKAAVTESLQKLKKPRGIYWKNDVPARRAEGISTEDEAIGDVPAAIPIQENGLRFSVSPREGQKTGFFLDQRENRALARELARDRRVLNLFSYSGGFGVYAAAGGAASIEEVDISEPAIAAARRNHDLNHSTEQAQFVVADAFQFVRDRAAATATYDLIVCDPPAFARSRGEVQRAARGYKDINLYAIRLAPPGGILLTFSCSGHMSLDLFQKVIFSAAQDAGRRVSFLKRLGAGSDHPVSLFCPEGEYLKGFLLQVH